MNGNIKQFRQAIQEYLSEMTTSLGHLQALTADRGPTGGSQILKNSSARTFQIIDENRASLQAVMNDMDLLFAKERPTRNLVEDWKAKRQSSRLHSRADVCEQCAATVIRVAALAMAIAERATAQAVLARQDAVSAQVRELD